MKAEPDQQYEITLIGHSMGAIVLNELVRQFDDLPYKDIVFLAAACSIRDMENSVIPFLKKNRNAKFWNLCLHPTADAREINVADLPPRGSLLEWIDNFFSSPHTTLDRTLGKWENIIQSSHIFEEVREQVHIKGFSAGPDQSLPEGNPQRHGGFVNEQLWKPAFWRPETAANHQYTQ